MSIIILITILVYRFAILSIDAHFTMVREKSYPSQQILLEGGQNCDVVIQHDGFIQSSVSKFSITNYVPIIVFICVWLDQRALQKQRNIHHRRMEDG